MPIPKNASVSEIIREIIHDYKRDGDIGNIHPRNMRHALKIAAAIAYRIKREQQQRNKKKRGRRQ